MAINIHSIDPASGSIGVSTYRTVDVVLSTGLDPTTIGPGTLFVEGSSKEVPSGPFLPRNFRGTDAYNILIDPAYHGLLNGEYNVSFLETDGSTLKATDFTDTSGTEAYYTKITFTPSRPMGALEAHTIYICGTATDQSTLGISARTVFDPIDNVSNTGNGVIYPYGGFKDSAEGTFTVQVVSSGLCGDAQYRWKYNSESYSPPILTHSYRKVMKHGVKIAFDLAGTFQPNDSYTFLVKPKEYLANLTEATFITGEYGTQLPASSTSIVSKVAPAIPFSASPGLGLVYTLPYNLSCNIDTGQSSFQFFFNKELSTAFDTNGFQVYVGPANGDPCLFDETRFTPNNISISGSQLTVNIVNT